MNEIAKGPYMALQTYKRNGEAVITPVWVCEMDGKLYVWTQQDSWKVKRIRNRADVMVCSSDMRGAPVGPWYQASAQIYSDAAWNARVKKAMAKKYGIQFHLFNLPQLLSRKQDAHVCIEIKDLSPSS